MCTSTFIKRHILNLPKGVIFSTRELLNYGRRSAVDQCLYRLVKTGRIIRLAWGLFMTEYLDDIPPSTLQVAQAKAKAFNRQVLTDPAEATSFFCLNTIGKRATVYATNGHSSSFNYGAISIQFKGICPRKMSLGDDIMGLTIKALWQLGRRQCDRITLAGVTNEFKRPERLQFRQYCHVMPEWMTNMFMKYRPD